MNSQIKKIICDDSLNITKWHDQNNVQLSIVKPPYVFEEDLNDNFIGKFQAIMKQVAKVTKTGGICCLILDDDKNSKETMSTVPNKLIFQLIDQKITQKDWRKTEEIIWVKSSKTAVENLNPLKNGIIVDFGDTPFSTIHILEKIGSDFEYIDSEDRIIKLDLDKQTKEKWIETIWFIHPKKKSKFQERIPKEILIRLIQIFSNKYDLVLDPFSGFGITAIICKKYFRNFLCFDIDNKKINQSLKLMKKLT